MPGKFNSDVGLVLRADLFLVSRDSTAHQDSDSGSDLSLVCRESTTGEWMKG
jgi:hypothetical protein